MKCMLNVDKFIERARKENMDVNVVWVMVRELEGKEFNFRKLYSYYSFHKKCRVYNLNGWKVAYNELMFL